MNQYKIGVSDIKCIDSLSDLLESDLLFSKVPSTDSNYEWIYFDYKTTDEMAGPVRLGVFSFSQSDTYSFIVNVPHNYSIKEYEIICDVVKKVSFFLKAPIYWNDGRSEILIVDEFPSYPYLERRGAEAGCFHAYDRFRKNISDFKRVITIANTSIDGNASIDRLGGFADPVHQLNQYVIPFLFGIYESYLKDTLWCLYWHSDESLKVEYKKFSKKNSKLKVFNILTQLDHAEYEKKSVLNLSPLLNSFFVLLDYKLMAEIFGTEMLGQLGSRIERRNLYAHRSFSYMFYKFDNLQSDIELIEAFVEKLYDFMIDKYGWNSSKSY
jgi:hypothetical protein